MSRASNGPATKQRRNRVLKRAKGFRQSRGNLFRMAKETTLRADAFAVSSSFFLARKASASFRAAFRAL